jgi:RimJ/RimL family protein N-acetyltransferase
MPTSSPRLIYRVPTRHDLARLFAIYSDPQTQLFNPAGPMTEEAEATALLERWIGHWETHGYGWWAITRSEAPEHIIGFGGIALHDFLGEQRLNLGYRFAVEAWGQGFATEMGRTALEHGFTRLKLAEVYGFECWKRSACSAAETLTTCPDRRRVCCSKPSLRPHREQSETVRLNGWTASGNWRPVHPRDEPLRGHSRT